MTDEEQFNNRLTNLLSGEMTAAKNDPDRLGNMIERLSGSLGFTIAMAAKGDPRQIDTLCEGSSAYVHTEAVSRAPLVHLMNLRPAHDR